MTLLSAIAPVEETGIDQYLAAQADLTAVERFSQRHESASDPVQARYYRNLIPLVEPEPGRQYAFEVDLDACTGCKSCVAACHSLNGLDDGESWRSVTLLVGGSPAQPFQQTVTAACHHCVDPACLNGCPVDAYEKDPITGIVSHLDDQCIGCGYCTLTCPYEVPVLNQNRGIVRKCDMCKGRLAAGEAPACVQSCPNEAIAIKVIDIADARLAAAVGSLVPGSPPSSITVPTTSYISAKGRVHSVATVGIPGVGPAHAHPPLAIMLVLTQLSVGAFVIDLLVRLIASPGAGLSQTADAFVAVATGLLALGASVFHLGRPRYFYRAIIGLGHSWLSREVVAFGAFTGLAVPYSLLLWSSPDGSAASIDVLGAGVAGVGIVGVVCSVLIYTTTHRASWRPMVVSTKFALTAVIGGLASVMWASLVAAVLTGASRIPGITSLLMLMAIVTSVKLAGEAAWMRRSYPELEQTIALRYALGLLGGVVLPLLLAATMDSPNWIGVVVATAAIIGLMAGEYLERSLFFTTASPPR